MVTYAYFWGMKIFGVIGLFFIIGYANAQGIKVVNANFINNQRQLTNDTLYVINFWATWCKPCVEELPYFEKLGAEMKDKPVKILLVSTDMKKDLTTRLPDFISAKNLTQQVLFMSETNANLWIEQVNKEWSGAIPATWILYKKNNYEFFKEGEITFAELDTLIKMQLNTTHEK